ncbi:MAG: NUDIX hydrolase [Planctomycetes bacterium]|nr:NUDIX hydrolase [Planctomycetota bacterium]
MPVYDVRDDELPRGAGTGDPGVPVVAAGCVVAMRGDPLEVLLLRRREESSYAPGAWVFPGGAVEPVDRRVLPGDPFRACALRELFEETGIWIGVPLDDALRQREVLLRDTDTFASLWDRAFPTSLVAASRWITPVGIPRRYDTHFYYARVPDATAATSDPREGEASLWIAPADALERHRAGALPMLFPTLRHLESLLHFKSADQPVAARRGVEPPTVRPILRFETGRRRIEIP